jgi:mono/diheme cytochrome c family protein
MAGTEMPAFGETAGGLLTAEQVDVLVIGMRVRWKPKYQITTDTPPYSSNAIGRVEQGQEVFRTTCTFCHQQGLQKITDPTYLSLVSDQSLRTIVIAGRPDLGHPDWKHVRRNQPLTGQDVSDVIIYLHSLRSDTPGQPYPETSIKR